MNQSSSRKSVESRYKTRTDRGYRIVQNSSDPMVARAISARNQQTTQKRVEVVKLRQKNTRKNVSHLKFMLIKKIVEQLLV